MVIKRKAWAPLLVALGLALGLFGLLLPDTGSVAAQASPAPEATRSFSASSVEAGAQLTVTIDINYGGVGGSPTRSRQTRCRLFGKRCPQASRTCPPPRLFLGR